jgi:enamidase
MSSIMIHGIGALVTGDLREPTLKAKTLFIEDGIFKEIGGGVRDADIVIDAKGATATPGLIDGHCHPTFGEFTPAQEALGWISHYIHGGVTAFVSAGELHLPGLPLDRPDPKLFKYLAVLACRTFGTLRSSGIKMYGGTPLLVTGLSEADFDEFKNEGIRCVKFIFYDYDHAPRGEAEAYVQLARARGITVKIHSGGVSRSGVSRVAGADIILRLRPDVVAHINGGPIPMPFGEIKQVVEETNGFLEIASSGNYRVAIELMKMVKARGQLDRVTLGTDTPGGTGVIPRGMLRNIALLASLGGVSPEEAICIATGNTARAHGLETGLIEVGRPADLVLMGRIRGSEGSDVLEDFRLGNIPAISTVIVDGKLVVEGRSQQTPPPEVSPLIERRGRSS